MQLRLHKFEQEKKEKERVERVARTKREKKAEITERIRFEEMERKRIREELNE